MANFNIELGNTFCTNCVGRGKGLARFKGLVCSCVWRRAFEQYHSIYQHCRSDSNPRVMRKLSHFGFPSVEFLVDFDLIVLKTLSTRKVHNTVLNNFLDGKEWFCSPFGRGFYFHRLYEAQVYVGRVLVETMPLSSYFPSSSDIPLTRSSGNGVWSTV